MLLWNKALNCKRLERQHIIKLITMSDLCIGQSRLRIRHLNVRHFPGPAIKNLVTVLRLTRMVETVIVGLVVVFGGRFGVIDKWILVCGFCKMLFIGARGRFGFAQAWEAFAWFLYSFEVWGVAFCWLDLELFRCGDAGGL
jgi:hypothetical protein